MQSMISCAPASTSARRLASAGRCVGCVDADRATARRTAPRVSRRAANDSPRRRLPLRAEWLARRGSGTPSTEHTARSNTRSEEVVLRAVPVEALAPRKPSLRLAPSVVLGGFFPARRRRRALRASASARTEARPSGSSRPGARTGTPGRRRQRRRSRPTLRGSRSWKSTTTPRRRAETRTTRFASPSRPRRRRRRRDRAAPSSASCTHPPGSRSARRRTASPPASRCTTARTGSP